MPNTIEILDRLINFPTISRTPNTDLIHYVRDLLEAEGIPCQIIENESGSNANLYATVGPTDRPGIMLSGHTDVVPVEGQAWTVDPFTLTESDGRLYGRGTTDMKGFVACAIHATLAASKRSLNTPLHLALSFDEEIGCVGVRRMLEILQTAPIKPRFCIIGEPTELKIATGHKGKIAARAICRGKEVHSALAPNGVNAIHLASDFVAAVLAEQRHIETEGARDDAYDIPHSTIHIGMIRGGTALNIVPNRCDIDFEIRNIQQDDPDQILERIYAAAKVISDSHPAEGQVEIEIVNRYPGLETAVESEVVDFMKTLTGQNATKKVAFGTEAGLFAQKLETPCVVCGPGSMAQGHKPDEFVAVSQLNDCDTLLAGLIDRLAG